MAIQSFKEILENKAYRISSKDRKIFEETSLQSFFGFSDNDSIEFIIYDSDDNQLPQSNGELVRYIPLNSENIREYFLIADGTLLQQYSLPNEYFIDVERLIKEAGYESGLFKTQITLINKRVGSESPADKLWIQEISPSRTEVRLLPLRVNGKINNDLEERFNILYKDGQFRDDTIFESINFVEKIKADIALDNIFSKYSESFVNNLKNEFNINEFESLITQIQSKFIEAATYEFTNRISEINDINYGKPKELKPSLELSYDYIVDRCITILTTIIATLLPKQNVRETSEYTYFIEESLDDIDSIKQRRETDIVVETTEPEINVVQIGEIKESDIDLAFRKSVEGEFINDDEPYAPSQPPKIEENNSNSGGSGGSGGSSSSDNSNENPSLYDGSVKELVKNIR